MAQGTDVTLVMLDQLMRVTVMAVIQGFGFSIAAFPILYVLGRLLSSSRSEHKKK